MGLETCVDAWSYAVAQVIGRKGSIQVLWVT
jgi:hypothetical protein